MKNLNIIILGISFLVLTGCEFAAAPGQDTAVFNGRGFTETRLTSSGDLWLWNVQSEKTERFFIYNLCLPGSGYTDVLAPQGMNIAGINSQLRGSIELLEIPVGYDQKLYKDFYGTYPGGQPKLGGLRKVYLIKGSARPATSYSPCY